jgi:hypothetical protein
MEVGEDVGGVDGDDAESGEGEETACPAED